MKNNVCGKKCSKCNKSCIQNEMESLEFMLRRITVMNSYIGEYIGEDKSTKESLIVSGMRVEKTDRTIFDPVSKIITIGNFGFISLKAFNKGKENVESLLKEFLTEKYPSNSEAVTGYIDKLISRLRDIQSNKLLIVPVNVGRKVEYKGEDGKVKVGELIRLDYKVNKDTCKIESFVKIKDKFEPSVEFKLSDYGKNWWVFGTKQGCKEADDELIEMQDNGIIKPIEIGNSIIVENKYIYKKRNGTYEIIGQADEKEGYIVKNLEDDEKKDKAVKKLENNLIYLSRLQRIIGIYGFNECKEVSL